MVPTGGSLAQSVMLAGAAGMVLAGAALSFANAADLGGGCCSDVEMRVEELEATVARKGARGEKLELKITGAVNHTLLFWDDGGRRDTYVVGSATDGDSMKFEGDYELAGGWKAGFSLGFDILQAPADAVDQLDHAALGNSTSGGLQLERRPSGIETAEAFVFIEQKHWGKLLLGFQDTAADGVDKINLAESDVAADAGTNGWNGNFFLRMAGIPKDRALATGLPGSFNEGKGQLRWGDFVEGNLIGGTIQSVRYVSPSVLGFEASASWGKDDIWDVALRYNRKWGDMFQVAAGIGYFENRSEDPADPVTGIFEPKEDKGWGASVAVMHLPTGLNLAVGYSNVSHTNNCLERGALTLRCRGDDDFVYVKGGLVRHDLSSLGSTVFYGEYSWQRKIFNESEEDVLETLAVNFNFDPDECSLNRVQCMELKKSVAKVWGFGVVQKIEDPGKKGKNGKGGKNGNGAGSPDKKDEPPIEFYLGYRHHGLKVDLIDENGPVPAKSIKDFEVVFTGVLIRF